VEDVTEFFILKQQKIEHKAQLENTEKDLKLNQTFLQQIVDNIPYLLVARDLKGRNILVNKSYRELLKLMDQDIIGKTLYELFPQRNAEFTYEFEKKVISTGLIMEIEEQLALDDGTHIFVSVLFPLRNDLGNIFAIGKISKDITERKEEVEKIKILNEELEINLKNLKIVNDELSSFSYSAAHDLRAPLRHINGFIKLLRKNAGDKLDEKEQRYLDIINNSTNTMGILLDELLAFSRLGTSPAYKVKVNVNNIVNEVIENIKTELEKDNITWKVADLPDTNAEPVLIKQALTHLIGNSVKFSSNVKKAKIEIGSKSEDSQIIYFIRDNGAGFDMKYTDKLFGIFQRLHSPDEFSGIGIGLAKVKKIIEKHGGEIWAEGKINKGATFYFTLPL
jgi:PAS domain S-box-containing protein